MLSWYVTTVIIYFIVISLTIIGIFKRNEFKFNYNSIGFLAILGVSCIPILRIFILIGSIRLLLNDIEVVIKELGEDDEDDMPL